MHAAYQGQLQRREDSVCSKNRENIKDIDESPLFEMFVWVKPCFGFCLYVLLVTCLCFPLCLSVTLRYTLKQLCRVVFPYVCNITPVNDCASVVLIWLSDLFYLVFASQSYPNFQKKVFLCVCNFTP